MCVWGGGSEGGYVCVCRVCVVVLCVLCVLCVCVLCVWYETMNVCVWWWGLCVLCHVCVV